jgi:alpha/beta superfamily hydrolase
MSYRMISTNYRHFLKIIFALFVVLMIPFISFAENKEFDKVCLFERTLIKLYKAAITNPNATIAWDKYSKNGLEKDSFKTIDWKTIHGIVWRAQKPKGYIIIGQGTSMLVAEIYEKFRIFQNMALDVYLYDFRGYGRSSNIETTLAGIISDYRLRLTELNKLKKYKYHIVYGFSLGGIIFANATKDMYKDLHGFLFDSVPGYVPWYAFCPPEIDPVFLLPDSCANWLIIGAEKDRVIDERAYVFAKKASELCGAKTIIEKHFGHIFMDNNKNTEERIGAAMQFIKSIINEDNDE